MTMKINKIIESVFHEAGVSDARMGALETASKEFANQFNKAGVQFDLKAGTRQDGAVYRIFTFKQDSEISLKLFLYPERKVLTADYDSFYHRSSEKFGFVDDFVAWCKKEMPFIVDSVPTVIKFKELKKHFG